MGSKISMALPILSLSLETLETIDVKIDSDFRQIRE